MRKSIRFVRTTRTSRVRPKTRRTTPTIRVRPKTRRTTPAKSPSRKYAPMPSRTGKKQPTCSVARKNVTATQVTLSHARKLELDAKNILKVSLTTEAATRKVDYVARAAYLTADKFRKKMCKIPMNPACKVSKRATAEAKKFFARTTAVYVATAKKRTISEKALKVATANVALVNNRLRAAIVIRKKVCGR